MTTCPYCKKELQRVPTRKTPCPFCKKFIVVRTSPKTKERILVTEKQAKDIDEQWHEIAQVNSQIRFVKQMVGEEEFFSHQEKLRKRFGQEPNDSDVAWSVLNGMILKTRDLQQLKMIYYSMALLLNAEGKDCKQVSQESRKMELMSYKQSSVIEKIQIMASNNSCNACKKQNKKMFTIEQALKEVPIPCKDCTYILFDNMKPFCRCLYSGVTY